MAYHFLNWLGKQVMKCNNLGHEKNEARVFL
jgi:hypothetical protein